jgi:hypothetical protein
MGASDYMLRAKRSIAEAIGRLIETRTGATRGAIV